MIASVKAASERSDKDSNHCAKGRRLSSDYDFFAGARSPQRDAAAPSGAQPGAVDRFGLPIGPPPPQPQAASAAPTAYPAAEVPYPPPPYPPPPYPPPGTPGAPQAGAPGWPQQVPPGSWAGTPISVGRSRTKPHWVALIAAAVLACIAGGVYYATLPKPVKMPATLAGLPRIDKSRWPATLKQEIDQLRGKLDSVGAHQLSVGIYGDVTSPRSGAIVSLAARVHTLTDADQQQIETGFSTALPGAQLDTVVSGSSTYDCVVFHQTVGASSVCLLKAHHTVLVGAGVLLDEQTTADALEQVRSSNQLR